jgi:uncharacterized protein DUF397
MLGYQFTKSTYSSVTGCVAARKRDTHTGTAVQVRDTKDPHGPVLSFTSAAWSDLLTHIKNTPARHPAGRHRW